MIRQQATAAQAVTLEVDLLDSLLARDYRPPLRPIARVPVFRVHERVKPPERIKGPQPVWRAKMKAALKTKKKRRRKPKPQVQRLIWWCERRNCSESDCFRFEGQDRRNYWRSIGYHVLIPESRASDFRPGGATYEQLARNDQGNRRALWDHEGTDEYKRNNSEKSKAKHRAL